MFHCDMDFDPFAYLHNNKKVYGKSEGPRDAFVFPD